MQCTSPVWLPKYEMQVPCNNCRACRIARAREWSVRIMHELEYWKSASFLTLTYNEENVPENGSLEKTSLQRYIKRLRKDLEGRKMKYYACGEYGESSKRPHYHAIVFGLDPLEHDVERGKVLEGPALDNWGKGFVYIGSVTYDSARYVSDYIQKKYNGQIGKEEYEKTGREYPFQLQSLGLGKRWCLDNREYLMESLEVKSRGQTLGLPKYYQKILGILPEEKAGRAGEMRSNLVQELRDRNIPMEGDTYYYYIQKAKRQTDINLSKKASLRDEKAKL